MELPLYQYHPLDPSYIRLLELLPDATSRMKHVKLKTASTAPAKYAALSYTWGANTETYPFQCDGQNLPVRENLLHALARLKYVLNTPIWIDAMCINQSDESEKIGQIQIMTDIYKSAERVLIWLGDEIPETRGTFKQLRNVTAALKALKSPVQDLDLVLSPSFIRGIRHLLTCPWWPRLWVLQEATLAREATLICGSQLIPWKLLSSLASQIKRLDLYSIFRGHDQSPEFCDGFTELLNVNLVQHTHSTTLVTDLIRICRQRICFDPCDRVYGVIGLMEQYIQEGFTWEPGEKVEDLYPPFVGILLQLDTVAMILSLTETTQRNPKLPSWCPDLHYRSVNEVLADHEGYHAGFNIQTTTKLDWDQYQKDPKTLRIKGMAIDTVRTISPEDWADEKVGEPLEEQTCGSVRRRNVMLLQKYIAVAEKFVEEKILWRIFIGNMIGSEDSKLHWLAGFASVHDRLASWRWKAAAEGYNTAFHDLKAWLPDTIDEPSSAIQLYLKDARRIIFGRKFFTTEGGRVGFGPRSMAVDDVVCILKGTKVPFVFKRHAALPVTYYLRGEAYVHGLMHGEYLKVNKKFDWISII